MKTTELKNLIKEAVKEAIQEELKDILLEAVRSPKVPIQEAYQMNNLLQPVTVNANTTQSEKSYAEKKAIYADMLNEMKTMSFTSADARGMGVDNNTLQIAPGMNTMADGSKLPDGNVGLDMIMGLMNKK
jgi:predicted ATP-grasp superfamily ATP-dependent carboligase